MSTPDSPATSTPPPSAARAATEAPRGCRCGMVLALAVVILAGWAALAWRPAALGIPRDGDLATVLVTARAPADMARLAAWTGEGPALPMVLRVWRGALEGAGMNAPGPWALRVPIFALWAMLAWLIARAAVRLGADRSPPDADASADFDTPAAIKNMIAEGAPVTPPPTTPPSPSTVVVIHGASAKAGMSSSAVPSPGAPNNADSTAADKMIAEGAPATPSEFAPSSPEMDRALASVAHSPVPSNNTDAAAADKMVAEGAPVTPPPVSSPHLVIHRSSPLRDRQSPGVGEASCLSSLITHNSSLLVRRSLGEDGRVRRSLGEGGSSLLFALLLAWCAPVVWAAGALGPEALLVPAIAGAVLLLGLNATDARGGGAWAWCSYAALLVLACWTHRAAWVGGAALAVVWLAIVIARRDWRGAFANGGALAHAAVVALVIPWTVWNAMGGAPARDGEPMVMQLLAVLGALPTPIALATDAEGVLPLSAMLVVPLGILGMMLPLATALFFAEGRRGARFAPATLVIVGALAAVVLASACGFSESLLGEPLAPWAGAWIAVGVVLLAREASRGWQWPTLGMLALLAPWIVANAIAHWVVAQTRAESSVALWTAHDMRVLPPAGAPLFVPQAELIPFLEYAMGDRELIAPALWPQAARRHERLPMLILTPDDALATGREGAIFRAVWNGELSSDAHLRTLRDARNRPVATLLTLRDPRGDVAMAAPWSRFAGRAEGSAAVSLALPETQSPADGWSGLEWNELGAPRRWTSQPVARLRFEEPVLPGQYVVRLDIVSPPHPFERAPMTLHLEGERRAAYTFYPGRDEDVLHWPIEITGDRARVPVIRIVRPTWSPRDVDPAATDDRTLGVQLRRAELLVR